MVYPPVDIERFRPTRSASSADDFYLTVCRLVPYKRVDLLLDAFAAIPHKRLMVIGDGPEMRRLRRRAGSNVQLLAPQPSRARPSRVRAAMAEIPVTSEAEIPVASETVRNALKGDQEAAYFVANRDLNAAIMMLAAKAEGVTTESLRHTYRSKPDCLWLRLIFPDKVVSFSVGILLAGPPETPIAACININGNALAVSNNKPACKELLRLLGAPRQSALPWARMTRKRRWLGFTRWVRRSA